MTTGGVVGFVMGLLVGGLSARVLLMVLLPRRRGNRQGRQAATSVAYIAGMVGVWGGAGVGGQWATGFVVASVDPKDFVPPYVIALGVVVVPVMIVLLALQLILIGYEWRKDLEAVRGRRAA